MKLLNGDCLELMKNIDDKSIDLILTDPPYEMEIHGGSKNNDFGKRKLVKDKHILSLTNGFDYDSIFNEFLRVCKTPNILIFCSNAQVSKIINWFEERKLSTTILIWNKTNPIPLCHSKYLSDIEFIIYIRGKNAVFNNEVPFNYKKKVKTYPIVSNKNRFHPTQKPITMLKELIELHSKKGQIILDPFMGSGSTGVACKELERDFIGIELDEKYFKIAYDRINNISKSKVENEDLEW